MLDVLEKFQPVFEPRSVAFVGASNTPMKWGFQVLFNLVKFGYDGKVYPINPRESEILGLKVYRTIGEVPEKPVDLAVVTVPARGVLDVLKECAAAGVRAALVVAGGFGEGGAEGARIEAELARVARESGMPLVGPNCMGIVSPHPRSLYCQMPALRPEAGNIAMASQSGDVGATLMRLIVQQRLGMSRFVSTGNEAVLHMKDYIEYFGADPLTSVIATYIEGLDDGRGFLNVTRDVNKNKPVVVLKVGGTEAGKRAAKSHTGALGGSRQIFHGACRQAGLTEVVDIEEMMDVVGAFARQPLPRGRRVGIVTVGGGTGVLAADACADAGLDVVPLPDSVLEELDSFLPPFWSRGNPVDLIGGRVERSMVRSTEILLRSDKIDGVIVLGVGFGAQWAAMYRDAGLIKTAFHEQLATMAVEQDVDTSRTLAKLIDEYQKPVIVASSVLPTAHEDQNEAIFAALDEGLIVYPTPRRAARAFAHLAARHDYLASVGAAVKAE
jgi:acyl-CoA synthetase (NDP forming)